MILVIDNYDSFTYNLVQYLGELGADPLVVRNDAATVDEILELKPDAVVISPGPGVPARAAISIPLVRASAGRVPVLGVCLGHQVIGEAFGGKVVRADRLMHGKTSPVAHTADSVFRGLPSPIKAMRYHSLLLEPASLPGVLSITAWTDDRTPKEEIMGLRHESLPVFGVQFHPESIGTEAGKLVIKNFLDLV